MDGLTFRLDEAAVEAIALRAAELVLERMASEPADKSPWLSGAAGAAEYLGWPVERVYKHVRAMPHYRHGNRLMFRRDELDSWIESAQSTRYRRRGR